MELIKDSNGHATKKFEKVTDDISFKLNILNEKLTGIGAVLGANGLG